MTLSTLPLEEERLDTFRIHIARRALKTMQEERLYKYRSLYKDSRIHTRAAILEQEIFFARPSAFNDPFECRVLMEWDGTEAEQMAFYQEHLRARDPRFIGIKGSIIIEHRRLSELARRALELGLRETLARGLERDTGIFCLSALNDDILMWSHYADRHRGMCLEFACRPESTFFSKALPVRYQDEYPRFNCLRSDKFERAEKTFLTKSRHWEYEREYRIVDTIDGPGTRSYPEELLTGVILGCAISEEDEKEVRSWISQLSHQVIIRRAVREEARFALRIEPA